MDREKLKIIKIGLDIDDTLNTKQTHLRIMRYKYLIERYNVYISASGRGLHFEIYLKRPITIGESFKMRENLGDDQKRLTFSKADFERGWDFDILFTYKKVMDKNRNYVWKKRKFLMEEVL